MKWTVFSRGKKGLQIFEIVLILVTIVVIGLLINSMFSGTGGILRMLFGR